jgi:hypothetical protein
MRFEVDDVRKEWRRGAKPRIQQPLPGSLSCHSATSTDEGTVDRAPRVIRAGRPAQHSDADGSETTAFLTRPPGSPARTVASPLAARLRAGLDATAVPVTATRGAHRAWPAGDEPFRDARTSAAPAVAPSRPVRPASLEASARSTTAGTTRIGVPRHPGSLRRRQPRPRCRQSSIERGKLAVTAPV